MEPGQDLKERIVAAMFLPPVTELEHQLCDVLHDVIAYLDREQRQLLAQRLVREPERERKTTSRGQFVGYWMDDSGGDGTVT